MGVEYALGKAQEVSQNIKNSKEEVENIAYKVKVAQELVKSMGELKGGLMKLGQMLSITEDLILPQEISELFKTLQKNAPSMSEEDLNKVFIKNFGKKPSEVFTYFEAKPFAAASIGQVHVAVLPSGEKVAVKVQYPKIVNAIKSDMLNIKEFDRLLKILIPNKPQIDNLLEELKTSLLAECDYVQEANSIEYFREIFRTEFSNKIIIPQVYREFSTNEILTTQFMTGDSFEKTLEYPQEIKDELGELLYESFLFCLFNSKILHTDPQEGNYLFHKDKIIMLDFGSTRKFDDDFLHWYSLLCFSVRNVDKKIFRDCVINLGINEEQDSMQEIDKSFNLVADIYKPFLADGKYPIEDLNPFRLIKDYVSSIKLEGRKAAREEFIMLDRANIGLFTKIKKWKSSINWKAGRDRYQIQSENTALKNYVKK
jgi:predicted unusual protein kinase regulating ubiquinone biosynthesis (AarF/ABC1/UbiB family)